MEICNSRPGDSRDCPLPCPLLSVSFNCWTMTSNKSAKSYGISHVKGLEEEEEQLPIILHSCTIRSAVPHDRQCQRQLTNQAWGFEWLYPLHPKMGLINRRLQHVVWMGDAKGTGHHMMCLFKPKVISICIENLYSIFLWPFHCCLFNEFGGFSTESLLSSQCFCFSSTLFCLNHSHPPFYPYYFCIQR